MAQCLKCGKEAEYAFHVLEIQTLHIRDLTGEKRVQALGEFQDYAICKACAAAYLADIRRPGNKLARGCVPFIFILVLGIALTAAFWNSNGALRLMGLAAMICGVLGLVSTMQGSTKHKREFDALHQEEAMAQAAWECMLEAAPSKGSDNDLTYIPVNKKTMAMKNGDLMILYDMLPAVAAKAYDLIHDNSQK